MKDLHQQYSEIINWKYTDFLNIIEEFTNMMKDRNKAEREANKDQEDSFNSKISNMQKQYSYGMPKYKGIPNFPNITNFKW